MENSDDTLTPRQEAFCREYLVDFNGTQAAIRAKYSESGASVEASRLLVNPKVQKRISELVNAHLAKVDAKVQRILNELYRIAFADIAEMIEWDNRKGMRFKSAKEMGRKTRVIASIESTEGLGWTKYKFKMHDKLKAIELLGKYHALWREQLDLKNSDGSLKQKVYFYLPAKDPAPEE